MGVAQWMRVLDTVGGLIQMSTRFRRTPETDLQASAGAPGPLGQLEARLAGVVVAGARVVVVLGAAAVVDASPLPTNSR